MEKQHNTEYDQTDPDYIDQNTLVDGSTIQSDDQYKHDLNKEQIPEFGESDPDYIDQNTLVDNDNYARDEDPYQYQEEFIEDLKHPENDFENNKTTENNTNKDNVVNSKDENDPKEDNE